MRTLNKFRSTNKICVTGVVAKEIAKIVVFFEGRGENVVGLGHDDSGGLYTVRVIRPNHDLADFEVEVYGECRIRELETIVKAA